MVVNRDIKRKRKVNTCINLLDDSPKRTKVHAQRKFAQGSNVSSPVITPVKEIEKQERSRDLLPEPAELLPIKRPNTEDFLTFLCFRGTPILPAGLNFFNTASMIDTRVQTDEPKRVSPKNGPIITHNFNKSPNERPFIAFGVRKRADPVVISKQMEKKRRHALALQALRRKYQEQKMAKIRAVTISKLSEKITSKSVVRTRSVTKNETITKKNITHKVVTTRTTIKQPIRGKIKSKMCLRSFRGRYIHHELGVRTHKKKPLPTKKFIKPQQEKKKEEEQSVEKSSSEFSSDDDEPLVKTVKPKVPKSAGPRTAKKTAPGPKKTTEVNYRLTRSHRVLLNNQLTTRKHAKFFTKTSGGIKATNTKIINKKVMRSSRILKKRIGRNTSTIQNKIQTRRISQRTSKRLKSVFHEAPKRMQTRSEPKKEESAKQNAKMTGKKSAKVEQSSEPKEKCVNKKEEPKKVPPANEGPKKLIEDKVVEVDKKVLRKTDVLKFNKDKCDGALKKVAIVKISKAESEKTNESEKMMTKKEETSKIVVSTPKKIDNKKNDEVHLKKEESSSVAKTKNEKVSVSPPKKIDNKKNDELHLKKEESSSVAKTKNEKVSEPKKPVEAQKINKKDVGDGDGGKHNLRKLDVPKVAKTVDSTDKTEKKKSAKDVKDVANDKTEKTEEQAAQVKPNEEKTSPKKDVKCKSKPEVVQQTDNKTTEKPTRIDEVPKPASSKKLDKPKKDEQEKVEPKVSNSRPTRKTKEAAAIYMEILGHKLVNDMEIDDDDVSIDSFPELPNVRKTEQRENELKAKAKFKANDAQDNSTKKPKEVKDTEQIIDKNEAKVKKEKAKDDAKTENIPPETISTKIVEEQSDPPTSKVEDDVKKSVEEKKDNLGKRKSLNETEKAPSDQEDNLKKQKQSKKSAETEKTKPKKKVVNIPVNIEKRQTRFQATKPFLDMSFSDSDESFTIDMKICGTVETKQVRKKPAATEKKIEPEPSKPHLPIKPADTTQVPRVFLINKTNTTPTTPAINKENNVIDDEDKSIDDSDHCSSMQNAKSDRNKKKTKIYRMRKPLDQSFSDSDEEPLSKLTQVKEKKPEPTTLTSKLSDKNKEEIQLAGKPKRECTKRPQNYLPLFSSSDDEEKYFHGFVKTETKTLKDIRNEEEKCVHSLPSDLLCKDIGRRFGKGKVNMSNEQIEKWLNDSALAVINVKKENDEMLKFGEKIPAEAPDVNPDKLKLKTDEPIKDEIKQQASVPSSPTPAAFEKQLIDNKPLAKPVLGERKTIFRKEKSEPVRNVNAFSANNESSVYAFQAENEDSISTPFRRPSRRPSSTATSKSEDEISKLDDISKYSGKFRLPTTLKTNRPELSVVSATEDSNSTPVPPQSHVESPEVFPDASEVPEQKAKKENDSGTSQKLVKAKLVAYPIAQKLEDKCTSSMFPPMNLMQKSKFEGKHVNKCTNNRSSDRLSETSEEFKYKIPSSPSASSSSSAKLYKRQKARYQPLELCTPVQVSEFPSVHCLAQMVEAPVFYPTEKEFQDPIEYIEKIRMKASKFGICRIVPPSNFKPECKVSDDMRFTAYNQYVHKMLHRWGPNFKELMAIKKYLQTQNITLTHPPWIGGMEIDLPRLYQTVQLLGGLKEVIEKKKWPKVSEAMKIPKSAQDRLTKLDDIYCKYLLPYDTLSPAEREKLFDEVETEWAKRESKTLLKVQQKISKCEAGSESDSDPEDESEECIVKGRNMALNAFYRIARNTMSMWFKTPEPLAEEVEQEFWKHVTLKNNHICVHSGSIDSGNWGYGFAVSKNSPFARHAWNLKVLTNNSGSVLRSMGPLMGVTVPTLHVGMVFSACCWYRDPHSLPWIEYLHTGANKIWYGIPDSMSECFHSTLLKLVPNYCKNKSLWLPSDTVMIPPNLLVENGVSLSRTVQEPGQFIVVFPKVFTSSISTGYVVSESVYFAPPYWLESAQKVFEELKNSCESSMFSLDRLILSVSSDPRSNVDVLRQIIPAVQNICDRERKFRGKLTDLGLSVNEKLPLPEAPAIRKRKKLQDDNGDYECETCHTNLFISLIAESQEDAVYCLEHASNKIEAKKIEVQNCKLMFTYDGTELDQLIEKINATIEAKMQKKLPGKYSNMPTMLK